jgi:hypothetical protein
MPFRHDRFEIRRRPIEVKHDPVIGLVKSLEAQLGAIETITTRIDAV